MAASLGTGGWWIVAVDFVKNTPNKSRASGSNFLDAVAADSHCGFQHDQWRDSPVLRGGDGASGGGTRWY